VIGLFEQDGKVLPINGQQEIDAVYEETKKAVASYI